MKRLAVILVAVIAVTGTAAAGPKAIIQDTTPPDIILDSDNGYQVTGSYDGSGSTGTIETYAWAIVETDQSDTGPTGEVTFDQSTNKSEVTVRLTVTNGSTAPNSTSVREITQTLRDIPDVSISADSTDVDTGETVSFTSSIQNSMHTPISSHTWYLADGTTIGTGSDLDHSFDSTGTYDVTLNATDDFPDTGQSNTVTITVTSPDTGSDDSGGGGSGAPISNPGPPEHAQVFNTITPGSPAVVDISMTEQEALGVQMISVSVSNEANDVSITVREQDGQPADVSTSVSGKAYRFMDIEAENLNDTTTEEATIQFDVNTSWINDNDINVSTVRLERYTDNAWEKLPTEHIEQTGDKHIFNATTPGFSYFAVATEQDQTNDDGTETNDTSQTNTTACGNGICEEGETATSCPADCGDSRETRPQQANETLQQADEKIGEGDPGYSLLQEAREAYQAGNYEQAQSKATQAIETYQDAQSQEGGLPIVPVIAVLLIAGLLYWKRDHIRDQIHEALDQEPDTDTGSGASETLGEPIIEDSGE